MTNDAYQSQQHKLLKLQSEVDFQRKQYSVDKLDDINKALAEVDKLKYEVGMSKMTLDLKADQEELDRCFSRLRSYTPLS